MEKTYRKWSAFLPLSDEPVASDQSAARLSCTVKIGWSVKRQSGSHRVLERAGYPDYVFAFHDGDEIGPRMLARIAKKTGLQPDDL
jgi:predicted RNA binding protein YcfA (HicA-like mRNA interferase family)